MNIGFILNNLHDLKEIAPSEGAERRSGMIEEIRRAWNDGHGITLYSLDPVTDSLNLEDLKDLSLVHLRELPYGFLELPQLHEKPTRVYEHLKHLELDKIVFQDIDAIGHSCFIAKKLGLYFQKTSLALVVDQPHAWKFETKQWYLEFNDQLLLTMEKQCYELADEVLCHQPAIQGWITHNWKKTDVLPKVSSAVLPRVNVSVISYNRPFYLRQLIQNLEDQDYPNFQVLIVDNGSTEPEALAYFQELNEKTRKFPIQVVRHEINEPFGKARNRATQADNCDYVIIIDDDDLFYSSKAISQLVSSITTSGVDVVTAREQILNSKNPPQEEDKKSPCVVYFNSDFFDLAIGSWTVAGTPRGIYKRSVFDTVHYEEERGTLHEDQAFHLECAIKGYSRLTSPEILFWYRKHGTNVTVVDAPNFHYKSIKLIYKKYYELLPSSLHAWPALLNQSLAGIEDIKKNLEEKNRELDSVREDLNKVNQELEITKGQLNRAFVELFKSEQKSQALGKKLQHRMEVKEMS